MPAHVYILRCTTRAALEVRIAEHDSGRFGGYTSTRRPVSLVFTQEFQHITDAIAAERQLKGWSRAKKEALIAGDYDLLRQLSRGRSRPT